MSGSLVRCSPGVELVAALGNQVQPDSWVRGFGVLRDLAIAVDPSGGSVPSMLHEGTAQLASLDAFVGRDGVVASVVVSVPVAGTWLVAAGRLERAIVVDVHLFAQPIGAAGAVASLPAAAPAVAASSREIAQTSTRGSAPAASVSPAPRTASAPTAGRPSLPSERPAQVERAAPARPAPPAGPGAWAQVAALSERVSSAHGDEPDPVEVDELERGDVLVHPTLGRCVFLQGIDTDAARVKLPNGSPQKLMLRVFDIVPTGQPKTFQLRKRE